MPIYKRCSRCGKRMESGKHCPCLKIRHKEYDKYSRDRKSRQFYTGKEWDTSRTEALEADGGIDVYLYMTQGIAVAADTVHHIIPLKDEPSKRSDLDNLISLHHDTHSLIETMYKTQKDKMIQELSEMVREYRSRG